MARINPDPYAGGHLFALVNRVTGLLDSEEEVMATVKALEADGVAPADIDIFTGEQGARCLDLSGREHGRAIRLLRMLEAAVGGEAETHQRIDQALRQGASLLCVKVHGEALDLVSHGIQPEHAPPDGPDENVRFGDSIRRYLRGDRKNDEKARAFRILQTLHAHEIHFWGPWAFEDVPSS